jgi:hypothetical protein
VNGGRVQAIRTWDASSIAELGGIVLSYETFMLVSNMVRSCLPVRAAHRPSVREENMLRMTRRSLAADPDQPHQRRAKGGR